MFIKGLVTGLVLLSFLGTNVVACQSGPAPPTAAPKAIEKAAPETKPTSASAATKGAEKPAAETKPVPPKPLTKLQIAYSTAAGEIAAVWVAKEAGLYEKNGIDAELVFIAGSTKVAQAMVGGDVKIGQASAPASISGALAGGDLVMVGGLVNVFTFSLFTPPSITSVAQLKGKAVGTTGANTAADFAARYALKKNGLDPSEVTFLYTGGTPESLAALLAGGVQGGILGVPITLQAKAAGLKELVDISQIGIPFGQAPIMTTRSFVKQNPDLVRGVMKAIAEAIAVAKQDKAMAKRVLAKYLKTDDDAVLEESYQIIIVKAWPKVPYIPAEAVKTVLETMDDPKAKSAKPEDFIDNSFVKELEDSGFIDKLYKR